ncbi:MAG: TetR/AcrR family transcriptional regulator [Gammaproteobacteria bacterium]|nr:TetR/AcrR family transcriptional regulator [Gammaproteobacteria bacterium]
MKSKATSKIKAISAKPSTTKPNSRRERRINEILAVAQDVFEEFGYDTTTVTEVARRIGVVEGTVFAYFESKRELMSHVIQAWYASLQGRTEQGLKGITGFENRLRFVIWSHLTIITENSRLCSVILTESRKLEDGLSSIIYSMNKEYTLPVMRVMAEGIDSGELRSDISLQLVRNVIFGSVEHAMWDILEHRRQLDVEQYTDDLTTLVLTGLRVKKTEPDQQLWSRRFDTLEHLVLSLKKNR